jgi:hypothetical protein
MLVYAIVSERDLRASTCEYGFAQAGRPFETGGERVSPSFVFWTRRTRSWSKTFSRVPLMDAGDCRILARIPTGYCDSFQDPTQPSVNDKPSLIGVRWWSLNQVLDDIVSTGGRGIRCRWKVTALHPHVQHSMTFHRNSRLRRHR